MATPPLTRTHSCDFAYFKSAGTLALIKLWREIYAARADCPKEISSVAADQKFVICHFELDCQHRAFGDPEKSSLRSQSYRLDIVDK